MYCLCPVAPFGVRVQGSALQQLLERVEDRAEPEPRAWLQAAFPEGVHAGGMVFHPDKSFLVRSHVLETAAPLLQGPLNLGLESCPVRAPGGKCGAVALGISYATAGGAAGAGVEGEMGTSMGDRGYGDDGGGMQCAAAVLVGWNDARVYAHVLDVNQLAPRWGSGMPQLIQDKRGDVVAVRTECEAVAAPAAAAAGGSAAGATASRALALAVADQPQMLMLDRLDLQLQPVGDEGRGGGWGGDGTAADDDEDYDDGSGSSDVDSETSDAGYNPARPTGSRSQAAAAPAQLPLVRFLQLHICQELPGRFWACLEGGCWGVNLKWLPTFAKTLQSGGADGDTGFGGLGFGLKTPWPGSRGDGGGEEGLDDLPPPLLAELLLSDVGVISSSVVGSEIMGTGCVVLERGGQMSYLRPRPGAAAAATAGGGGSGEEEGAEAADGGLAAGIPSLVMSEAGQQLLAQAEVSRGKDGVGRGGV